MNNNGTTTTAITVTPNMSAAVEAALIKGDLKDLSTEQRIEYFHRTCESLGLNHLTKPFEYLTLNGKTMLYATRNCTDQLRALHNVSTATVSHEQNQGLYIVTVRAFLPNGRQDEATGAVVMPSSAADKANAIMKAETKAKRRATLSLLGLSFIDESELDTVRNAQFEPLVQARGNELTGDQMANLLEEENPTQPAPAAASSAANGNGKAASAQADSAAHAINPVAAKKLTDTATANGWLPTEARQLLKRYGYGSTTQVARKDYDTLLDQFATPQLLDEIRAEITAAEEARASEPSFDGADAYGNEVEQPAAQHPATQAAGKGGNYISEAQAKRLYAIAMKNGHTKESLAQLVQSFGYETDRVIDWHDYNKIVEAAEKGPQ